MCSKERRRLSVSVVGFTDHASFCFLNGAFERLEEYVSSGRGRHQSDDLEVASDVVFILLIQTMVLYPTLSMYKLLSIHCKCFETRV